MSHLKSEWLGHGYRPFRQDVELTVHGEKQAKERLGLPADSGYHDVRKIVCEAYDKALGPDPAWKVPRVRWKYRYIQHDKKYVMVFEMVKRDHINRRPLARLITVVGPFKEGQTWKDHWVNNQS